MDPNQPLRTSLRPDPAGSTRLNRTVLLCNLGVLLVNAFLAFKTNDVQLGLMRTASEGQGVRVVRGGSDVAMPYSRVLQTLDSVAPGQSASLFTPEKLEVIHDAIAGYQAAIAVGINNLVYADRGRDLRVAYAELDKDARHEVEIVLASKFSDGALVQRLATEVIRSCR